MDIFNLNEKVEGLVSYLQETGYSAMYKLEHGKDADGHDRPADDGQGTGSAPFAFKPITPQTNQRVCDCVKYTGAGDDIAGEYG